MGQTLSRVTADVSSFSREVPNTLASISRFWFFFLTIKGYWNSQNRENFLVIIRHSNVYSLYLCKSQVVEIIEITSQNIFILLYYLKILLRKST